jgi:3D (Asp-Asp-Asp) domain-containing protein
MKILQKLGEEIVPLSRKQNIVLLVIITCIFQFALFYAPALADEAVNKAKAQISDEEIVITNDSLIKEPKMGEEAAILAKPVIASTSIVASTTPASASSTEAVASSTAVKVVRTSTHTITAYNSEAGQTDDSPCITANGYNVCKSGKEDTIAANFLKFGTKVKIPELFGDRVFVVRDRMNKKHPNRVDVWMVERSDAIQFGVKVAKIQVIEVIE